jgi:hypothetical protein
MQKDSHIMKIDTLIAQYLYKNRKVSIQQIGTFELDDAIPSPIPEQMKVLPEHSIHFKHDEKTPADEGFILFIMEQTKKIRPLATSDLESFSTLNRQFLNIGKPLVISNLGTLIKTQNNEISFAQGQNVPPKPEAPKSVPGTREQAAEPVEFREKSKAGKKMKWILPLLLLIIVSGMLILLFFKINLLDYFGNNEATPVNSEPANITPSQIATEGTSSSPLKDTIQFNLVLLSGLDSLGAKNTLGKLQSQTDSSAFIEKTDTLKYRIVYPIKTHSSDSIRISDSILQRLQIQ